MTIIPSLVKILGYNASVRLTLINQPVAKSRLATMHWETIKIFHKFEETRILLSIHISEKKYTLFSTQPGCNVA